MFHIPIVIEQEGRIERSYDLFSRLMKDRIVFLGTEINDHVANVVIGSLLFLESENPNHPINFYINSPGGSVTSTLAIIDTMNYIKPIVKTICVGQACSGGALILACGEKGHRFALPNSRIMIHQPLGGVRGQTTDMQIQVNEMLKLKQKIIDILAAQCNQEPKKIEQDCERDNFMSADEAVAYGLIDQVLTR